MQQINVSELKVHPRNDYFFDDIQGDNWKDFLKSINERGVIEPIVVTQDLVIVSGHQRVRACKELGKELIMTDMRNYQNDDDILRDLIDTNLKQRGIGNPNPIKLGRCIIELERIYGIGHGGDRKSTIFDDKSNQNNFGLKTQQDLANKFELTDQQLRNYKKLAESSPEIQDMLNTGNIKPTVALKIITSMNESEQEKFFKETDVAKKITQKQVEKYLEIEKTKFEKEKNSLILQLEDEKRKDPIKIDNPEHLKKIELLKKDLAEKTKLYNIIKENEDNYKVLMQSYKQDSENYNKLKRDVETLTKQKNSLSRDMAVIEELTPFIHNVSKFIKTDLAPTKYTKAFKEAYHIEVIQNNLLDMINLVRDWADEIENELNVQVNNKNIINVEVM